MLNLGGERDTGLCFRGGGGQAPILTKNEQLIDIVTVFQPIEWARIVQVVLNQYNGQGLFKLFLTNIMG